MHLSVIVPVFNEQEILHQSICIFYNYLIKQDFDFEIIIVNDGSTDDTKKIALQLVREKISIRFIDNAENRGKGAVVSQGLLAAKGDFRLFLDADNSTSIDHLEKVWPIFKAGADLVIGSRNCRDASSASQEVKQSYWKRQLGRTGNKMMRMLFDLEYWDTQCGFKVFTKKAAEEIVPRLKLFRWLFDVEMLLIAKQKNFKIGVVPVVWKNRQLSRVGFRGYAISVIELFLIKKNLIFRKYE